ncbi:MAG: glycosyltransferase family 4 protein [Candidatus Scalinduaceae bacterium]
MATKRIIMIEPCGKRGIIHYTHNLSNELVRLGHQVLLVTSLGFETKGLRRNYQAIEVFDRFMPHPFRFCNFLIRTVRIKPDIIHLQGAIHPILYFFLLKVLRRISRAKFIYTAHEVIPKGKKWYGNYGLLTRLYQIVNSIIVHANTSKEEIVGYFNIKPEKIFISLHGNYIFFRKISDDIEDSIERCSNQKVILFFGIIEERKGLIYLIRAFSQVRKKIYNVRLLIVGQPFEDVTPYLKEIKILNLQSWVDTHFEYIPVKEVSKYFRFADIVVLPYIYASQSGVIAAAYSFAKPVIATNCGGLSEMVEDGKSGFIVPAKDVESLTSAMVKILKDDILRDRMGKYAERLAREKFSWDKIAKGIERIYES